MRILEGTSELRSGKNPETCKANNGTKAQRQKLDRDRETVKDVISRALVEIVERGEFSTLQRAVRILHGNATYPINLRLDLENLLESRAEVIDKLNRKQAEWLIALHTADHKIATLRDNIKDDIRNSNARLNYIDKWLFARHESLQMKLELKPPASLPRLDHEVRVHEELVKAYELQIQEREKMVAHWKQRYSVDIAGIETRLTQKCEQLRVAVTKHEELQSLYNLHEGEMRAWLTFKRERAARIAREQRLNAAAKSLQAWWRGVMVRRALGEFRYLKNLKKAPTKSKKK
ncbi:hypothetical protein ACJJTC_001313 [Scirpophaga incertulas]